MDDSARMYEQADKPVKPQRDGTAAPAVPAGAALAVLQAPASEVDTAPPVIKPPEPDPDEESPAERLYDGGEPPADGNYEPLVRQAFGSLEVEERDNPEHMAAIAQGREQVVETLREWGVGAPATRELSAAIASYRREPQSEEAMGETGARTEARLRETWGSNYDKNVRFARAAFNAACQRMPWLAEEMDNGAGNDATVIQHFARIGRRMARTKT
jgi:hypothetical protein